MPGSEKVQAVLRALDLLRAAAEAPGGRRLGELAEATGLGKTTAHNLVRTLCARGFLVKDAAGRFVPGVAIQELARLGRHHAVLGEAARQMRRLAEVVPTAVITFSELTPAAIFCRLRLSPDRPGETQRPLDRLFAPYVTVTAVCLQATAFNAAEFERQFPFEEHGAGRWASQDAFLEAKSEARRRGVCVQRRAGHLAVAFAVPENYALGFSLDHPPADVLDRLQEPVGDFRSALAGVLCGQVPPAARTL
jgi:DNA-binding IclR family transcriptional regulator